MRTGGLCALDFDKDEDLTAFLTVNAALAVTQMINDAENWSDGLTHLLDATLWPVVVAEKLFRARNLPSDLPSVVPLLARVFEAAMGQEVISAARKNFRNGKLSV